MQHLTVKAKVSKILATLLLCSSGSFVFAEQHETKIMIPKVSDAKVFAQFTDKTPAVLNYFTQLSESEIITFYQESYGEILHKERKRGRLTLSFNDDSQQTRVVISQQNNHRQVDIIVNKQ